jgi:hypothetical protein
MHGTFHYFPEWSCYCMRQQYPLVSRGFWVNYKNTVFGPQITLNVQCLIQERDASGDEGPMENVVCAVNTGPSPSHSRGEQLLS